jgi:hypothetical protein
MEFSWPNANIFMLNSTRPKADRALINKWLNKHEFWYEKLPNEIFEKCAIQNQMTSDFVNIQENNDAIKLTKFILNLTSLIWLLWFGASNVILSDLFFCS